MRIASLAGPLELGGDYFRWVQAARSDQAAPAFDDPQRPPSNVGDWFVTKIVDRLLQFDEVLILTPHSTPRDWDEVNDTCDVLLLKGGNYLFPGWFERYLPVDVLERFRIPIVMFGAGIQHVPAGGVPFTAEDLRSLRLIHDRSDSSAVRGHLSAEVLAAHGISNVTVTGCPTLFWSRQPTLPLPPPSFGRVGFTLRNHLYSDDPSSLRSQYDAMRAVRDRARDVVVVLQGEERHLQLHRLATAHRAEFVGRMRPHGDQLRRVTKQPIEPDSLLQQIHASLDGVAGAELVDWMTGHTYTSWDPDGFIDLYRSCDLMVGCRLHSNLVAMANGTPAYFLTYDDRTRELVDLLGSPGCDVGAFDVDAVAAADWSGFERCYEEQLFPTMTTFLDRNHLTHRLAVSAGAVEARSE